MNQDHECSPRPPARRHRRTRAVVAVGASTLVAVVGAVQLQGASAEPIGSDIGAVCAIGGSSLDVTVPVTVDDKIDPVVEGGHETLETTTGLPSLPVEVTINKLVVTTPIPTQIASTDSVVFTGGNVTGSYEISGANLIVTFTGPVSSSELQVPTVTAEQTVASGIGATMIDWLPFNRIEADTSYGLATCTPNDPGAVVNSTTVEASATAPDAPPPTEPPPPAEPPPTTEPTPTAPASPAPTPAAPLPGAPTVPGAPGVPGLPPVPGLPGVPVPSPSVPEPAVPSLPAPALPTPAVPIPVIPGVPPDGCAVVPGLPPVPGIPVPCVPVPSPPPTPPLPNPDIDVDGDIVIEIGVRVGLG